MATTPLEHAQEQMPDRILEYNGYEFVFGDSHVHIHRNSNWIDSRRYRLAKDKGRATHVDPEVRIAIAREWIWEYDSITG